MVWIGRLAGWRAPWQPPAMAVVPAEQSGGTGHRRGMTKQNAPDKRHGGPRQIAALVPGLLRPALGRRAPATVALIADWEVIAGPAIAAAARVRRLSAGTLTLACSGPVALELQHLAAPLIERVNTHLGRAAVARLRFVQAPPAPLPAAPAPPPAPAAQAEARAAVAALPPGPLRDALEALGRAVLTRERG